MSDMNHTWRQQPLEGLAEPKRATQQNPKEASTRPNQNPSNRIKAKKQPIQNPGEGPSNLEAFFACLAAPPHDVHHTITPPRGQSSTVVSAPVHRQNLANPSGKCVRLERNLPTSHSTEQNAAKSAALCESFVFDFAASKELICIPAASRQAKPADTRPHPPPGKLIRHTSVPEMA
eukprot:1637112-Rhodomonas_salina.2